MKVVTETEMCFKTLERDYLIPVVHSIRGSLHNHESSSGYVCFATSGEGTKMSGMLRNSHSQRLGIATDCLCV